METDSHDRILLEYHAGRSRSTALSPDGHLNTLHVIHLCCLTSSCSLAKLNLIRKLASCCLDLLCLDPVIPLVSCASACINMIFVSEPRGSKGSFRSCLHSYHIVPIATLQRGTTKSTHLPKSHRLQASSSVDSKRTSGSVSIFSARLS